MGEHPTWDSADGRPVPGGTRGRSAGDGPRSAAVTVEELLARQGASVGRRAARRVEGSATAPPRHNAPPRPPAPGPAGPRIQRGLPPVPGAAAGPPVPPAAPEAPATRRGAFPPPTDPRPPRDDVDATSIRRSGPVPPLPGRPAPTAGADASGVRRSTPIPPLPSRVAPPLERQRALRDHRAAQLAGRAARRATATPGRRRIVRVVLALVVVLGLVALYPLGLYFYVDRSMDRVAALATDGPEILAPQLQAGSENYLVVGTSVPGEEGAASVKTLLVSVAPDGSHAVLLTVPSTALVDTPQCRADGGRLRDPRTEALASALLSGGPSCLVRAVQEVSGLRIDHYLDLDLSRLPGMVDALGGVRVCVQPSTAVAAASRPLPAGSSRMTGAQASAYLRPADPRADATGVEVAQRAQLLLTATLHAAISTSTLTDPASLTRFLHRAAGALTVDEGTTLGDLRSLGTSLGALSDTVVQRAALPVADERYVPKGSSRSYVLLDDTKTRALFDAVIGRTRVPAGMVGRPAPAPAPAPVAPAAGKQTASAPAPGPAQQPLTVAPAQISVDVLNGTATTGLAGKAAAALKADGFGVGTVGNAPAAVNGTVVRYGPQGAEQARTLAAAVPGAVLQADPAAGAAVQLVVGPNYSSVVPVHLAPASSAPAAPTASSVSAQAPKPAAPPVRC